LLEKKNIAWLYFLAALFIAINVYLVATRDTLFGLAIPIAVLAILLFFFAFDKAVLLTVFTIPLSIDISDARFDLGISIPGEILLIGIMLVFIGKLIFERKFDGKLMRHPMTIIILIYLSWILITAITSVRPVVSFKFLVARLWFIIPMYFVATQLMKNPKNVQRFLWCYIVPLIIACIYTLLRHASRGFTQQAGHWVMYPFYNDHTAYGAALALFFPALIGLAFSKQYSKKQRFISLLATGFITIALVFSYCRAAWVSLAVALGVYFLIVLKIKFRYILIVTAILVGTFFAFQHQIVYSLEKNQDDSSSDFSQHLRSITNISTDASNVERLNRWSSAIRMYKEKPVFGWGPGTYQFEYAPFQTTESKSVVSTNHGDLGNAHSEYLGPLAESGLMGMLTFITLTICAIYYGIKVYQRQKNKKFKQIALWITLGLVTYFIHGILNNFLDTDKLAVPFWGFIAILIAFDLYYRNDEETETVEKIGSGNE
jgi:O-antigen ligase